MAKKKQVKKEIDALQAQAESLAAAQKKKKRPPEAQPEPETESLDTGAAPGGETLTSKFEELFSSLEKDINETSTTTCLAIFALGILVSRALAV